MNTIHHPLCGVIPPHILCRVGAEATLAQMREIAEARAHTPVDHSILPAGAALTKPLCHRRVCNANHETSLPGKLIRSDHKTRGGDVEVAEAWDGSGATWDFFQHVFGRDSIDGRGMTIVSSVHYSRRFDNAMWDGRQMVYGDGDGRIFNRFTVAKDVIGHELTHGITQHTAGLAYAGQTGALNEHISDAFGIMVKQYTLGQTVHQSDWIIGAGLFTRRIHGQGIRSMAAPGTAYDDPIVGRDPQPSHMRDYVETEDDNGGVHINSGIPNHAFYLAAMAIGGRTWEVLGKIWFEVLTKRLKPDADFGVFSAATVDVAGVLFGGGGVQQIVAEAWTEVGLPVPGFACTTETGHVSDRLSIREVVARAPCQTWDGLRARPASKRRTGSQPVKWRIAELPEFQPLEEADDPVPQGRQRPIVIAVGLRDDRQRADVGDASDVDDETAGHAVHADLRGFETPEHGAVIRVSDDARNGIVLAPRAGYRHDSRSGRLKITHSTVIVKRARSGDGDAFQILCDRYTKAVWRLAWLVTRDVRDAEEITQETFFHVWSRLADFDESDFPKWLMTIARNAAIDRVRRREVEQRALSLIGAGEEKAVQPEGERRVWSGQIKDRIARGMERLTDAERIAVVLRFHERLTYAEVGESLGISEIAAQMAVQRAISKLRISLKDLVRYLYARN